MKDETYSFISDVKDRESTARSARNRRTHTGKGGKVRLPSDNLSKKELMKMSGECKSYRLNDPMAWKEFKSMPDDLKITYIKLLRNKFNPPVTHIAKMMGVIECCVRSVLKKLNLTEGHRSGKTEWDKEGFWAWINGVDKLATTAAEVPIPEVETIQEEPEAFVEEDIPWSVPEQVPEVKFLVEPHYPIPQTAVPCNGSMTFKCPANLALNTLKDVLANEMVEISVMWRVIEEGGANCDKG